MKFLLRLSILFAAFLYTYTAYADLKKDLRCRHEIHGVSPLNSMEEAREIWTKKGFSVVTKAMTSKGGLPLTTLRFTSQPDKSKYTSSDVILTWSEGFQSRGGANRSTNVKISMAGALRTKSRSWKETNIAPRIQSLLDNWCSKGQPSACGRLSDRSVRFDISKKQNEPSPNCAISFHFHGGAWKEGVRTNNLP